MDSCWVTAVTLLPALALASFKSAADGVHGGELGGHRHAQHEQRQDHQPQRHARALQGELGDQYPDDNGDADQRFTVAEPAQHLSDGGFRHQRADGGRRHHAAGDDRRIAESHLQHERH